jgi:hypothetical protein
MSEWCLAHPWMTLWIIMSILMCIPTSIRISWPRKCDCPKPSKRDLETFAKYVTPHEGKCSDKQ